MKWIQWTDMHVGLPGQETRAVDVRANTEKVVEWLEECSFDRLVLTGDICYDFGRGEVYEWLVDQLRPWKDKVRAIPGNHDDSDLIVKYFPPPGGTSRSYFEERHGDLSVYFLDSGDALLSEEQWNWFEERWQSDDEPAIVFMHHPPLESGVPYMDRSYAFIQSNRFLQLLDGHDRHCHLFCGHYHLERTICRKKLNVYISPTSFFQIDPSVYEFKVDHHRMGLRSIEWAEGQIRTWVDYRDP